MASGKYAPVISKRKLRECSCFHYIIFLTLFSNIHLDFRHGVIFLIVTNGFSSPQMQTCVGKNPPLIIPHYFPSSFSMFLLCGGLPIPTKSQMEEKRKMLWWVGNLLQQPGSTTQSSTGFCSFPKIIPAACKVKHRKPAAAPAFALANSGGCRCTSRGETLGKNTPIYLSAHVKRFLHQLCSAASLKLLWKF